MINVRTTQQYRAAECYSYNMPAMYHYPLTPQEKQIIENKGSDRLEKAYFGGGCFWCTEAVFEQLEGVLQVRPGYAGGKRSQPSYEQVSTGATGHAEVVEVWFDSQSISYEQLLDVFFHTHNPTTRNQQGADKGTQYRSIIFTTSPEQMTQAQNAILTLTNQHEFEQPIVTEVKPLQAFYAAEDYHHHYYQNNPDQAYCQIVINPKLKKFNERFKQLLKQPSA